MYIDVFMSYNSTDFNNEHYSFITDVERFFKAKGLEAYNFESRRSTGKTFKREVIAAIETCSYFCLLTPKKPTESYWVNFEFEQAIKREKTLLVAVPRGDLSEHYKVLPKLREVIEYIEVIKYRELQDVIACFERKEDWLIDVYIPGGGYGGGSMIEFSAEIPKVLYPIGNQPMLFRAINSLKCKAFGKAYVFNKSGEMASELIGHLVGTDRQSFPIKIVSKKTVANHWPEALKSLDPKRTFLLQLCDALLWLGLNGDASESQLRENWLSLVRKHREERKRNPTNYLGTLIVSDDYMIPAGVVKYSGPNHEVVDDGTTENPSPGDLRLHINTGNALLEPEIFKYVEEHNISMLGDAIKAAIRDGKIFTALDWTKWYHVLSQESWKVTHQKFEN